MMFQSYFDDNDEENYHFFLSFIVWTLQYLSSPVFLAMSVNLGQTGYINIEGMKSHSLNNNLNMQFLQAKIKFEVAN